MDLYKYVTEERLSILEDGLIRFTQPQAFNDPFELKPHIASLANNSDIENHFDKNLGPILREEYEKLPKPFKEAVPFSAFLAFAETKKDEMRAGAVEMAQKAMPIIRETLYVGFEKNIGILSLTENHKNLLMWAHYANSHQGFVIKFDGTHEFFDQRKSEHDQLRHLKKIKYSPQRVSLTLNKVTNFDAFLVKGNDWEYEQEWRIIFSLADAAHTIQSEPHDIYLFQLPFPAIKSILIGARASKETKERILDTVTSNPALKHVEIISVAVHESRFELVIN